jgi:hypothetical protein
MALRTTILSLSSDAWASTVSSGSGSPGGWAVRRLVFESASLPEGATELSKARPRARILAIQIRERIVAGADGDRASVAGGNQMGQRPEGVGGDNPDPI